jgi:hypothetical protein
MPRSAVHLSDTVAVAVADLLRHSASDSHPQINTGEP